MSNSWQQMSKMILQQMEGVFSCLASHVVYSHDIKPGDNPVSNDNKTGENNKSLNMSPFPDNFRTADTECSFQNAFITPRS